MRGERLCGGAWLPLLANGLLLCLLLTGTAVSCATAYALEVLPGPLQWASVLLAVLSAGVFSLPRLRWAAVSALGAGYALSARLLWSRLLPGARSLQHQVSQALFGETPDPDPPLEVLSAQERTLALLFLLAPLALLLGWAVVRLRSHWAAFFLTVPLLVPALLVNRLPAWSAFLTLMTGWCAMLLASLCVRRDPNSGARLTLTAIPATALTLGLLTTLLPQEDYQHPTWAAEAKSFLLSGKIDFSLPEFLYGRASLGGSSEVVNLKEAGPLRLSERTVLRVETDVPGRLYLRGYSAGVYTGGAWRPLGESVYGALAELPGGYEPLNFPAAASSGGPWHAVTVESAGAPGRCLYLPYFLVTDQEEISGGAFIDDSYLAKTPGTWRHTVYFRTEEEMERALSPLSGVTAEAELAYRTFVYTHYLDVPEGFEEVLLRWAHQPQNRAVFLHLNAAGEIEPEEVAGLLSATTRYDEKTPVTPEGADFVDHFLNESGRGYCMHYASAATLILRYFGYPARYVSGFTAVVPPSGRVNVPESAAHAWVEVYRDGVGWVPLEVTPGYAGEDTEEDTLESASPVAPEPTSGAEASSPVEMEHPAGPSLSLGVEDGGTGEKGERRAGQAGWTTSAAVLAAVVFSLSLFGLRRAVWKKRLEKSQDPNRAVLWAYGYLQKIRPWGGEIPSKVEALAQKARFSQYTLTEEERRAAAGSAYEEAHRVAARLPWWKRPLFRALWGFYSWKKPDARVGDRS